VGVAGQVVIAHRNYNFHTTSLWLMVCYYNYSTKQQLKLIMFVVVGLRKRRGAALVKYLSKLLSSGQHSDCSIMLGEKKIALHRLILQVCFAAIRLTKQYKINSL
jgi:hypothetical protein